MLKSNAVNAFFTRKKVVLFFTLSVVGAFANAVEIKYREYSAIESNYPSEGVKEMIVNFTQRDESNDWYAVNDSVMGGNSRGGLYHEQGYGVFSGNISLENNGGFSSVVKPLSTLPAQGYDRIIVDIEGDGHIYQVRASVLIHGMKLSYKHDVHSKKEREKITLLLRDFTASFRGRLISNAPPLLSENINQVGVLISDKSAEDFAIKLYSMAFTTE